MACLLYDLQYEENTVLPRLENQLTEKKKEIGNIVTAIQKGVASDTLMQRLNDLEEQKKALEEQILKERATSPLFTKEQFKMALCNFRKIDVSTKEGKAKLIDTFIDRIYLYDDHIKIIYNINGNSEEISLEELESSNLTQYGQPKSSFSFIFLVNLNGKRRFFYAFLGTIWGLNETCSLFFPFFQHKFAGEMRVNR